MDKSTPKKLYSEFLEGIQGSLKQMGFTFNKKEAVARRREQSWVHSIGFDPIWSPWGLRIDPHFWFREDHIQRVWGLFYDFVNTSDSSTFNLRLWTILEMHNSSESEVSFEIEDAVTLSQCIDNMKQLIDQMVLPFMNKMHHIADFDNYLNQPAPSRYDVQQKTFFVWHASPGLIAAKLNHNPAYESFYEKYIEILTHFNNISKLEELKALKIYMDARSVEELLNL
ncbi:hypothetical protein [Haliscomenobacter hydrossis]|uniref:Uncharacterized protein n=1 Tax=Haliscomenobacter hydrossis (strain ATCC 27775 / DSM 1100 / LMG 10767 / O) TaxID=760192 RepID=F4KY54_HALH1|nr:hypothetical protein [Haliscomenobacter hydrossis]AEE53679.1 hypothetical protein Halhy_5856 [Haliscomenobacter hydrossis DSM 1100]